MSLKEQERKYVVQYRIERAHTALQQARLNSDLKCLEVVANRLYYAAYYAVSALLIANGINAHTHEGNITQFGLHFVKTGKVSREQGKLYRQLFTMRLNGDYSDKFGLQDEDVTPYIEPTETFIRDIEALALESLSAAIDNQPNNNSN